VDRINGVQPLAVCVSYFGNAPELYQHAVAHELDDPDCCGPPLKALFGHSDRPPRCRPALGLAVSIECSTRATRYPPQLPGNPASSANFGFET
jgi:hypothetical protein